MELRFVETKFIVGHPTGERLPRSLRAILPLIVIGVVLERYLIKGMTAGAVK